MQTALIEFGKSTLPILGKMEGINLVGRYFDYKENTAMIEAQTQQLKEERKVIIAKIDAELKNALDRNDKHFRLEMFRLEQEAENAKSNAKMRNKLINAMIKFSKSLNNPHLSIEEKEMISRQITLFSQNVQAIPSTTTYLIEGV